MALRRSLSPARAAALSLCAAVAVLAGQAGFKGVRPLAIGHRGFPYEYPENTIPSFKAAAKMGVDVVEMDVHLTKDGRVAVIHDSSVDRTTDGEGLVILKTLEELNKLDAGYRFRKGKAFPWRGKGVRIPTLDEVFEALPDAQFNIEVKQGTPPMERQLADVIMRHGVQDRVLVATGDPLTIMRLRTLAPAIPTTCTSTEILALRYGLSKRLSARVVEVPPVFHGIQVLTSDFIPRVHRAGAEVYIWTIDDEPTMRDLIARGADGILTNRADVLLRVLGRRKDAKPEDGR